MPTALEFITPRRTKRSQPIVSRKYAVNASSLQWNGEPIYSRPTNREMDLINVRVKEPWEEDISDDSDPSEAEEDQDTERQESIFYGAFERLNQRTHEVFRVGDTVLVSSNKVKPSIAVIIAMWSIKKAGRMKLDEWNMRLRIRWFLRPNELASIRRERSKEELNEIYLSLDQTAVLTPRAIVSHCTVTDTKGLHTKKDTFYCANAIQPLRGLHYTLDWPSHRRRALEEPLEKQCAQVEGGTNPWDVPVPTKVRTKGPSPKKRKVTLETDSGSGSSGDSGDEYEASLKDEEPDEGENMTPDNSDEENGTAIPQTPSKSGKRQRAGVPSTPRTPRNKRIRPIAQPTPHSKRRLATSRKMVIPKTAPSWLAGVTEELTGDRWLRAKQMLHVGNRPTEGDEGGAMPCREEEYARVLGCVKDLVEEGSGGCIYISGVPGTGKTATVHAVVRELKRMAHSNEINPFTYVEINGLRLPEPTAAYSILWRGISGDEEDGVLATKMSHKESLKALNHHFSSRGSRGPINHACVVLMDELDQLVTTQQDVVYNFFNWPTLAGSRLVVLAVANTMDLPERVMSGRVRSRLGMTRINFQPYTRPQLEKIVTLRLQAAKEGLVGEDAKDVIEPDGIKLAAMKVSSVSGDARRVLDMCRRTIELVHPLKRSANAKDVGEAIKVLQNSSSAAYLRECSFHERLILASLIKVVKREGVEEVKWGDVQYQHALYVGVLAEGDEPTRVPSTSEMGSVLNALVASRAMLMEPKRKGLASLSERKVVLGIERDEVERVLGEVGGPRWKSVLAG